ncbi:MAG: hypothetical protein WC606_00800 [Candidatus Absconditabacterales bacterium]
MKSISSNIIAEEAEKLGCTISVISDEFDIFIVQKDGKNIFFKNIDCGVNTSLGMRFARFKTLTYCMLSHYGIKVPTSFVTKKGEKYTNIIKHMKEKHIQFPLVIKPAVGEHGNGVSVKIKDNDGIKKAIKNALKFNSQVIIQEFFEGEDHRLLIVNHKFIAGMKRIPAFVVGNGTNTIKELINKENKNPLRGKEHEKTLTQIPIDAELKRFVTSQGFTLDSIIPKNKKLFVRKNANLSTGGVSIDITDQIHPEIKRMAEQASKILGLYVCGIDYLSKDITKPLKQQHGGIIEVNHTPGLRGHHFPAIGKPRNVAKEILKIAFK